MECARIACGSPSRTRQSRRPAGMPFDNTIKRHFQGNPAMTAIRRARLQQLAVLCATALIVTTPSWGQASRPTYKDPAAPVDRRVETMVPVLDPDILAHLKDVVLQAYLRDTDRAMTLDANGRYERPAPTSGQFNAQQFLLQHYAEKPE